MIGAIARLLEFDVKQFKAARTLESVRKRYYYIFGRYPSDVMSMSALWAFIGEAIFVTAKDAFFKYASTKEKRGYKHDTKDLIKSMGVVCYQGNAILLLQRPQGGGTTLTLNGQDSMLAKARFEASKAHSEQNSSDPNYKKRPNKREHYITPENAFKDTYDALQDKVNKSNNVITVAFIASMPYARRLEYEFGKRVLVGAMPSIEGRFSRLLGVNPKNKRWEKQIGGLSWQEAKEAAKKTEG